MQRLLSRLQRTPLAAASARASGVATRMPARAGAVVSALARSHARFSTAAFSAATAAGVCRAAAVRLNARHQQHALSQCGHFSTSAMAAAAAAGAGAKPLALATDFVKAEAGVVTDFLKWLNACPSHFHAVEEASARLTAAGFKRISEKSDSDWAALAPGGKYFFTRNQSTIFAFAVGGAYTAAKGGFTMAAAHTDSPVLKVKPVSKKANNGYLQVAVECYGGGLWNTWFDRDLSLAGRVIVSKDQGKSFESRLVRINRPILRIPELAIHLNRGVNDEGFKFNTQQHLYPILASQIKAELDKPVPAAAAAAGAGGAADKKEAAAAAASPDVSEEHHSLLLRAVAEQLGVEVSHIRNFELCLYDTQPATTGGLLNEFVFARGLDNLEMSYVSLQSLIASASDAKAFAADPQIRLIALFDNEEVGSASQYGAASNMMSQVLKRIVGPANAAHFDAIIARSMLISADMAHGLHPNYSDKHEELHKPQLHKGLVIKQNANQRYATTAVTTFVLSELAKRHALPIQKFVVRNDCACGSTIGPILSANSGLRTIDVGLPQWSMHSIRETSGTADLQSCLQLFVAFFNEFRALDDALVVDAAL